MIVMKLMVLMMMVTVLVMVRLMTLMILRWTPSMFFSNTFPGWSAPSDRTDGHSTPPAMLTDRAEKFQPMNEKLVLVLLIQPLKA